MSTRPMRTLTARFKQVYLTVRERVKACRQFLPQEGRRNFETYGGVEAGWDGSL